MSDVWSLGVILDGIVTAEDPWKHTNINQLIQQIQFARYTLPGYLSVSRRHLISRMLVVVPEK
jgi:serine/threonine protein kinase